MEKSPALSKRRKYDRICMDQVAKLQQGIYSEDVFLFDISLKGVCFSEPNTFELAIEHPCVITFSPSVALKNSIEMKLEVVRVEEDKIGATWREIDIKSLRSLANLIEIYTDTRISLDDIPL